MNWKETYHKFGDIFFILSYFDFFLCVIQRLYKRGGQGGHLPPLEFSKSINFTWFAPLESWNSDISWFLQHFAPPAFERLYRRCNSLNKDNLASEFLCQNAIMIKILMSSQWLSIKVTIIDPVRNVAIIMTFSFSELTTFVFIRLN